MNETFNEACSEIEGNVKPYVVSADIKILLGDWAANRGFVLPSERFFTDLRNSFTQRMIKIFPGFELVSEDELSSGIKRLISETDSLPVSLDRVYFPCEYRIDIARLVDSQGMDKGLGRRPGQPNLLSQFRTLRESGVESITLVDDVVFSGDLLERVSTVARKFGIEVTDIVAGIAIKEGVNKLKAMGVSVRAVRIYSEVVDEICERDFYPGVPFSGRQLKDIEGFGVPYMLPFGNPTKWASIPESQQLLFSRFCLDNTIYLFSAIEEASGKIVRCSDLDRKVLDLPNNDTRFTEALKDIV